MRIGICRSRRLITLLSAALLAAALGCGGTDGNGGSNGPGGNGDPNGDAPNGDDDRNGDDDGDGDDNGDPVTCPSPNELTADDVRAGAALDGGCYVADEILHVTAGTLELRGGTTILFEDDAGLVIRDGGALSSVGTDDDPNTLGGTTAERGHWYGVYFSNTRSQDNRLTHTHIRHAGREAPRGVDDLGDAPGCLVLRGEDVRVTLDHLDFRECRIAGLIVAFSDVDFANLSFSNNESPIWLSPDTVGELDGSTTFDDNDFQGVVLVGGGSIRTDTSWINPGVPYLVVRAFDVWSQLTLAEGTTFLFGDRLDGIDVERGGSLRAVGSEENPIVFRGTEPERGHWFGLRYEARTDAPESLLEHAVVAHGRPGIKVDGRVLLTVRSTHFEANDGAGLDIDESDDVTVDGSRFVENDVPIETIPNGLGGIGPDNTFEGNDDRHIAVTRGSLTGEQRVEAPGIPYRVTGTVDVFGRLTLAPATRFEFERDVGLEVTRGGQFLGDGSSGEAITLTGAQPEQGFWRGIAFTNNQPTGNAIANVDILYAGSSPWDDETAPSQAGIFATENSTLEVNDTRFHHSGGYGLSVLGGAQVSGCDNLGFENNAEDGVIVAPTATAVGGCEMLSAPQP